MVSGSVAVQRDLRLPDHIVRTKAVISFMVSITIDDNCPTNSCDCIYTDKGYRDSYLQNPGIGGCISRPP